MPDVLLKRHRLLILGSCVSRDILNFDDSGRVVLADYFARSSIASLTSKPVAIDETALGRITSAFQRRTVKRDADKEFMREALARGNYDVVLIDLIDERFDLFEFAPGALVTVSSEMLASGFVTRADRASERWIASGSERHRALWKTGVAQLFATLRERDMAHRVIVNRVFWADCLGDGSPLPGADGAGVTAANELLAWMYAELEKYVPPGQWMRFPDSQLRANAAHRWGIAPFHYSDEYYRSATAQLHALADSGNDAPTEGVLSAAKSAAPQGCIRKFAFLVFDGERLVHKQDYSNTPHLRFDTPPAFTVVELALTFRPDQPRLAPTRTIRTVAAGSGTSRAVADGARAEDEPAVPGSIE